MQTSSTSDRPTLPPISSIDQRLPSDLYPPSWLPSKSILTNLPLPSPPLSHMQEQHDQWERRRTLPHPLLSPPQAHTSTQWVHQSTPVQTQPSSLRQVQSQLAAQPQRDVAIRQSIEQDMDHVVNQCITIRETISRQRDVARELLANEKSPWLDDMVMRANEMLNALLRLQKHQIAAQEEKRQSYYYGPSVSAYYSTSTPSPDDTSHWQINDSLSALNRLRQRKRRKRTVFQGRCHSCNISETPEWRRGPDGARTLCNACGLHYAKLERKRAAAKLIDNKQEKAEHKSPSSIGDDP